MTQTKTSQTCSRGRITMATCSTEKCLCA